MLTDSLSGEVVCGACGLVLIEKDEDSSSQSRAFDMEELYAKSRSGPESSLAIHDMGLSTNIDFSNTDASGHPLSADVKHIFDRLRKWDNRSKSTSRDRSLVAAFNILYSMKTKLAIPDIVIEEAAYIFRKALEMKLTKSRGIPGIICASLYAACRVSDTPRTLKDIAVSGNVKRGHLVRAYVVLVRNLELRQPSFDSSEFVTRIANEAGISEKTRRDALEILSMVKQKEISAGKNPMGLAASVLYLSCIMNHEKIKQAKIAHAAGVTTVTIRNRIVNLKRELDLKG